MSRLFTLPDSEKETHKDTPIYHITRYDKYADLPLVINCDNGKRAIIPTSKNYMRNFAPEYFKIFYKTDSNFAESKHRDGEFYEMTIPGLLDPKMVAEFIILLSNMQMDDIDDNDCDWEADLELDNENFMEFYCISKFFQQEKISEMIRTDIEDSFDISCLSRVVYEYDFDDFDDMT